MAERTTDDIIAFGMTRQEVIDAVDYIKGEAVDNDEDTDSYSAYAENMKKGRETLKKQRGYYPYLPKEAQ